VFTPAGQPVAPLLPVPRGFPLDFLPPFSGAGVAEAYVVYFLVSDIRYSFLRQPRLIHCPFWSCISLLRIVFPFAQVANGGRCPCTLLDPVLSGRPRRPPATTCPQSPGRLKELFFSVLSPTCRIPRHASVSPPSLIPLRVAEGFCSEESVVSLYFCVPVF